MNDSEYVGQLKARMNDRLEEIKAFSTEKGGYDKLPDDALAAIMDLHKVQRQVYLDQRLLQVFLQRISL